MARVVDRYRSHHGPPVVVPVPTPGMELVDLVREVVEKVGRIAEPPVSYYGYPQDPDRLLRRLVEDAEAVLDRGLLIGRGW
jgi:hypothetical protein